MARIPIKDLKDAYRKAALDTVKDLAGIVEAKAAEIIAAEAIDRGDLLASSEIELDKERPRAVVRWTADHAAPVHFGSRPHWAPFAPILAWVKRNLRRFETTSGETVDMIRPQGRLAERARRSPDKVAMRVARAIQAKIAREGTGPVPYASKAAAEANRRAATVFAANLEKRLGGT